MSARYAIYLAPPAGSPLEEFARNWLGRDHITGQTLQQPVVDGIDAARLRAITASPRLYGFHATMKAPFRLAGGRNIDDLHHAAKAFAKARRSFSVQLTPRSLKGFLALVPASPSCALDRLAADCVREFEPFRAQLSEGDIQRRRRSPLTPRQDAQMLQWGYPYVFDDFSFHMTLTERLAEPERDSVLAVLQREMAPLLDEPFSVREIAIYAQAERRLPFTLDARFPFADG